MGLCEEEPEKGWGEGLGEWVLGEHRETEPKVLGYLREVSGVDLEVQTVQGVVGQLHQPLDTPRSVTACEVPANQDRSRWSYREEFRPLPGPGV